jgi:hypothetical protein
MNRFLPILGVKEAVVAVDRFEAFLLLHLVNFQRSLYLELIGCLDQNINVMPKDTYSP